MKGTGAQGFGEAEAEGPDGPLKIPFGDFLSPPCPVKATVKI